MTEKRIRVAIFGASEGDLFVFGELHKRRDVEIAFVYDRYPSAVGLEIAEILRVPRVSDPEELAGHLPVDVAVVGEPRDRFARELELTGEAEVLDHSQALQRIAKQAGPKAAPREKEPPVADKEPYSIDDALAGFERLFDRKRLLKFLLDVAVQTTGATNGSIMLYSTEARELYIAYATGLSERVVKNTRQKLGEGIAGNVGRDRKGKLIRQMAVGTLYESARDRVNIASACSVPLLDPEEGGDRLLGVLNVSSAKNGRELTLEDLATLERLSRRIARILAEAIKLQEVQLRSGEMNLRQSVGELAEKPGSTGEKFGLLASLVAGMTGAESVEVFVSAPGGEWLVLGGSNRRVAGEPDLVRVGRGALARTFLEKRPIILTEPVDPLSPALASSFVFVPLVLKEVVGVLTMEFADRQRLDEFLAVKDSVALELARFIASERRERRLKSELASLAKVSEAAPALIACRSLQDLADVVVRLVADALVCERVTMRARAKPDDPWTIARYDVEGRPPEAWLAEDEECFVKLERKRAPFQTALIEFAGGTAGARSPHSVLAVPMHGTGPDTAFWGGIIAYDKRPATAVEDASFSSHDESVVGQVIAMVLPALKAFSAPEPSARPAYDEMLAGNVHRLSRITDAEMARADRYHHPFSLLLVRVPALGDLFSENEAKALVLADEIRQGFQTRTRGSDYGCWIKRDTYAMLSLEGTRRIKFLVSRLVAYLIKDLSSAGIEKATSDVWVGAASYPGAARSSDALILEAERSLKPHTPD
jgi:GAF domain-containing protein